MIRRMAILTEKNALFQLDENTFPRPAAHRAEVLRFGFWVSVMKIKRARIFIEAAGLTFAAKFLDCA
jgi:hypothetical protein